MKQITAILLGAGQRGKDVYGTYAVSHPAELKFTAVAEPDEAKRNKFGDTHLISSANRYDSWEKLLSTPKKADAIFICTHDRMHYGPVMEAMNQGYHILLEKPMSVSASECYQIGVKARKYDKIFAIAHVLRYTPFFSAIKDIIDSGEIGPLITIQHNENIGYWHFAHSFVRGNWRNTAQSSPMILQKTCHDLDILLWLTGDDAAYVSSFGSLSHFRADNAPDGAPDRCTDSCPAAGSCPFYAPRQYLTDDIGWPTSVISTDMSLESRQEALLKGPYGRCVYRCDNDVCDNQIVNIEFASGVRAAFTISAFTRENTRRIHIMGTRGEIYASMDDLEIIINNFADNTSRRVNIPVPESGHGGGDDKLTESFLSLIRCGGENRTSATLSLQSHLMAFAAEKSRLTKTVVSMEDFTKDLSKQ